jgi:Co/Zn/Cd efflux system component
MAALGRSRGRRELGDSPGKSLLAVTLGAFVIVPAIISLIHTFQRIQATQRLTRDGDVINGWIGLVLYLVVSPALYAYMQTGLNQSWEALRWATAVPPPYPPPPNVPMPPPGPAANA